MTDKAQTTVEKLGVYALILVVLIAGIFFAYMITNTAREKADAAECRVSVDYLSQVRNRWNINRAEAAEILKCEPNHEVSAKDSQLAVKSQLADKMASCWNKMYEGKSFAFKSADTRFCVVCDVIDYTDIQEVNSLPEFLTTADLPLEGITYADYLNYEPSEAHDSIQTDRIAVVYTESPITRIEDDYVVLQALEADDYYREKGHSTLGATAYVFAKHDQNGFQARLNLVSMDRQSISNVMKCDFIN